MNPRIVMIAQDPDTIFSYGLQIGYIIEGLKEKYDFHVISPQYKVGRPFKREGYVKWPSGTPEEMCTVTLNNVIKKTDPFCVFSMGDIQHYTDIPRGKNLQIPWTAWIPWDNHDTQALYNFRHHLFQPDIVVSMSDFETQFFNKMGFTPEETIYNIVDTETFHPIPDLRKKMDEVNEKIRGKKVLLFVGRPNWRKNLEFLLTAYYKLRKMRDDVILYLHVDFNDNCKGSPNLRKLIHALSLDDKIAKTENNQFTSGVSKEFLNNIYNIADLYITTHGGEGFGLPICEAMAAEVPFVATDCTTMPEFSGEGKRGLLAKAESDHVERGVRRPWVDIDEFVAKINYLLEREDMMKEMGKNGRKWVVENYSKEKIVSKWGELFDKLQVPTYEVDEQDISISYGEI